MPSSLTILGQPVAVDLDTFRIGDRPYSDPSRMLWYRSLLWLAVTAVDEREHGRPEVARQAVRAFLRAIDSHPDPGSWTPERLTLANAIGWDEGTVFRRAQALMCLSSITGPEAVRPALMAHARAMLDPKRYYGPPFRRVHNHGMLTNLILIDISHVLNAPWLRSRAIARLVNDYGSAFSPSGWAREGSSTYQGVNINGWREVQEGLAERGLWSDAKRLGDVLARGTTLAAHLISPSGRSAMIGNARPTDELMTPDPNPARPLLVADDSGGIATGRWSWTDRRTTWWTFMNQLRPGPHGHRDNLSLNWESGGIPVLVDPGQPDYDKTNVMTQWAASPQAHNRAVPASPRRDRRKIRLLGVRRFGDIDRILATTTDQGALQRREVIIDHTRQTVQVNDRSGGRQLQHWHLSPRWRLQSTSRGEAVFTAGRQTLTISSPGASVAAFTGALAPIAGWVISGFERQVPAPEVRISGGSQLQTTFRLFRRAPREPEPPVVNRNSTVRKGRVLLRWAPLPADREDSRKAKLRLPRTPAATGYRIQQLEPGAGWTTVRADTGSPRTRARISGLDNGVKYRFRIAALTDRTVGSYGPRSRTLVPGVRGQDATGPTDPTGPSNR